MKPGGHLDGARVGIVGGGVAGLTLALCAAARGATVSVFEQAPELGEVGAGLQLSPNALRVLTALGLAPEARLPAMRPETLTLRGLRTGRALMTTVQNGPGLPAYLQAHRADLLAFLADAARAAGVSMRLGVRAEAGTGGIRADGTVERFDNVAMAGGVRSARPGRAQPVFTGQVAWRALVDGARAGDFAQRGTQVFLGPGRHLVVYPLRDGGVVNLVGVEDGRTWDREGWDHIGDAADFRAAFAPACAGVAALLAAVETPRRWALYTHPAQKMADAAGTALLGDAAGAMLPFMAQGAAMAMEDAWALAACWDAGAGLSAYAQRRGARRGAVARTAVANGRIFHERRAWLLPFHRGGMWALGQLVPGFGARRVAWIYDYDVTAAFP